MIALKGPNGSSDRCYDPRASSRSIPQQILCAALDAARLASRTQTMSSELCPPRWPQALYCRICSRSSGGGQAPNEMIPSPPALQTAAANSMPVMFGPIGATAIGTSMPSKAQSRVYSIRFPLCREAGSSFWKISLRQAVRPLRVESHFFHHR